MMIPDARLVEMQREAEALAAICKRRGYVDGAQAAEQQAFAMQAEIKARSIKSPS